MKGVSFLKVRRVKEERKKGTKTTTTKSTAESVSGKGGKTNNSGPQKKRKLEAYQYALEKELQVRGNHRDLDDDECELSYHTSK